MITSIRSAELEVLVSSAGAELHSIKDKSGREFLWQAGEAWARHAPVLFPIVGKLKENSYYLRGQKYDLPQHGFARDMEFELLKADERSCRFLLRSNEESLLRYPYSFELEIVYHVNGASLTVAYIVRNKSASLMHFSIGAHPAFNCPVEPGERFEDYYLEFQRDELERSLLEEGLLSGQKEPVRLKDRKLYLSSSLFDKDALVFENEQISRVSLCSSVSARRISLECEGWPCFGIWSKKGNREFVCLEPWYGIADSTESIHQLESKKAIQELESGREFCCSFTLSFH